MLNAKRQRSGLGLGDLNGQQISADVIPGAEPRYYTTYLAGSAVEDTGAHGEVALFQEMRTTNIVPKTSAYQIAVEKASIDTKALPSFIAQVDTGPSNPTNDVNQLQSLVGFEMNWAGSLFPSTYNGSTIGANPVDVGSATAFYYSFMSTGGSSLPIKYSRSSPGFPSTLLNGNEKKLAPACEGVLQAYIENNPNSAYWQGQYNFNLDTAGLIASFNRALKRAFGMWIPWVPNSPAVNLPFFAQPEAIPGSPGKYQLRMTKNFLVAPANISTDQILMTQAVAYGTYGTFPDFFKSCVDFYPITSYTNVNNIYTIIVPCTAKQNKLIADGQAPSGAAGFGAVLYGCATDYYATPVVSIAGAASTQTLPSSTQIPVPSSTNIVNGDNMATLTFGLSTQPVGNASAGSVPCFDFSEGIASTTVQCLDTSVTLPNMEMGPIYVSTNPTRTDFLTSAWLLGFLPDTVFNMPQTSAAIVYANRPVAPAFTTQLNLAAYKPLQWKPSDANTVTNNTPVPGSSYYYGYGTSYYLDNVVNPGLANCFASDYDALFSGDLPSAILDKIITSDTRVNSVTDLSLNVQLYCMTYYNSASAPVKELENIKPWKANEIYTAGTPVTFANPDPNSPINNLYIANTKTGTIDFQSPQPFANTDYWLYCGPFIYSSAVIGATYFDGELVTYQGFANRFTKSLNNVRIKGTFSGMFGTPMTLVPRLSEQTLATGGNIVIQNGYVFHEFTSSGNFTVNGSAALPISWVGVGGGGGAGGSGVNAAGGSGGGGGGGGQAAQGTSTVAGGASPIIIIGLGGLNQGTQSGGTNGTSTTFQTVTLLGGGGGGCSPDPPQIGASGGGGGGGGSYPGAAGISGAGFAGGNGIAGNFWGGGGGGGDSAVGQNGDFGSAGGAGTVFTLNGRTYTLGGGGGGGNTAAGGAGGIGGGGSGGATNNGGQSAVANTGGGGGGGALSTTPIVGGNGGSGLFVISYPVAGGVYFGQYNLLKPTPVVGSSPPTFFLAVEPGYKGDVFEIRADGYGFGTYDSDKPRNAIHAYARDSWGCLQSNATSFVTNRVYDEFLLFECNTAFRDMFRGFSATADTYKNQVTGEISTYWVHDFIIDPSETLRPAIPSAWLDAQVMNDGISQSSLKYLPSRMVSTNTASVTSPQYLRNSDSQVYYWSIISSETSRYSLWDPVQSIIIEGNTVPVSSDNLPVSQPTITQTLSLGGDSRLILAEFFPSSNPAEDTAVYEPQFPRQIFLATGTELKYFSYKLSWRNKFTGEIIPLILSSVGSALIVFMFTPKSYVV